MVYDVLTGSRPSRQMYVAPRSNAHASKRLSVAVEPLLRWRTRTLSPPSQARSAQYLIRFFQVRPCDRTPIQSGELSS